MTEIIEVHDSIERHWRPIWEDHIELQELKRLDTPWQRFRVQGFGRSMQDMEQLIEQFKKELTLNAMLSTYGEHRFAPGHATSYSMEGFKERNGRLPEGDETFVLACRRLPHIVGFSSFGDQMKIRADVWPLEDVE